MTTVSHEEVEFFSETLLAQTSTIPNAGLGLFAKCDFKIGEEICDYIGTIRSLKEVNSSTFNTDYCLFLNLIRHVDALNHPEVLARYINDSPDRDAINVRFQRLPKQRKATVIALRYIKAGEELFVSYGRGYWAKRREHYPSMVASYEARLALQKNTQSETKTNNGQVKPTLNHTTSDQAVTA